MFDHIEDQLRAARHASQNERRPRKQEVLSSASPCNNCGWPLAKCKKEVSMSGTVCCGKCNHEEAKIDTYPALLGNDGETPLVFRCAWDANHGAQDAVVDLTDEYPSHDATFRLRCGHLAYIDVEEP